MSDFPKFEQQLFKELGVLRRQLNELKSFAIHPYNQVSSEE